MFDKFDKDKYIASEIFWTTKKVNGVSFALLLPLYIIGAAVYLLMQDYANIFATFFKATFILEIIILAVGVFVILAVALLAKAIILAAFSEGGLDSVKFKIIKETQKPYCSLTEPVKVREYQFSLAAYIFLMGFVPYIIALITGDFIFIFASFVCVYFTAADMILFLCLCTEKSSSYITDFDGILLYRIYEENVGRGDPGAPLGD